MTRIKVDADFSQVTADFKAMSRRSLNFDVPFRWFAKELQILHMQNFVTRGSVDGNVWKPLDPEYSAWKLRNYGFRGILVVDRSLRDSLTFDNSRGAVREFKRTKMRFGTNIEYAKFHQTGTRRMPERPPVIMNSVLLERLSENIAEHVTEGKTPGSRRLRTAARRFGGLFS